MKLIGQNYVPLGDNVKKSLIKPGPYPDATRSPMDEKRSPVNINRSGFDRHRAPLGKVFGSK